MNTEPRILNCTPHAIQQYADKDVDFANPRRLHLVDEAHAVPKREWGPSGFVANATKEEAGGDLSFKFRYKDVTELPDGFDLYIVSFPYLDACRHLGKDISKLRTIYGAIYDRETDRITIGCRGLCEP